MSLRSLLCSPEPNDPQDAEVAKHYTTDFHGYEKTARYWTETYASRDPASTSAGDEAQLAGLDTSQVDKFCNMVCNRFLRPYVSKRLSGYSYPCRVSRRDA